MSRSFGLKRDCGRRTVSTGESASERTCEVTLTPETSTDTPVRRHGSCGSLPGPGAGHPLQSSENAHIVGYYQVAGHRDRAEHRQSRDPLRPECLPYRLTVAVIMGAVSVSLSWYRGVSPPGVNDKTGVGSLQGRSSHRREGPTPTPHRAAPADRVCGHIDELLTSAGRYPRSWGCRPAGRAAADAGRLKG